MKSPFRTPARSEGLLFLVRGEPGAGRTRFALGLARGATKPIAILGNDRGARSYARQAGATDTVYVPLEDTAMLDRALAELEDHTGNYGGVIIDSITDWWKAEQKKHETEHDGHRTIAMRAWRTIREEHEDRLRILLSLGLHVILLAEERPIFERHGDALVEVGSREDTDRKDAYLADVRLRLFTRGGRTFAEVLKDRTGRYAMGAVVEDPCADLWIDATPSSSTTAPASVAARSRARHASKTGSSRPARSGT